MARDFIRSCSALGCGAATTAVGLGVHALPTVSHTKHFFSPFSRPLGAHGISDKSAPCHSGWLGEAREGKVTTSPTSPTSPTSLGGTPGQGCGSVPTMSSQQGGIAFFKPTLEAPQLYHKPTAEPGVLGEPL